MGVDENDAPLLFHDPDTDYTVFTSNGNTTGRVRLDLPHGD